MTTIISSIPTTGGTQSIAETTTPTTAVATTAPGGLAFCSSIFVIATTFSVMSMSVVCWQRDPWTLYNTWSVYF